MLADRNLPISTQDKAIEGLSGAAVLYTIMAVVLTCCLGGVTFFAFLGLALDVLFIGGMIAIAIMTRHGAGSCSGFVRTPLGNGQANSKTGGFGGDGFGTGNGENLTYSVTLRTACKYETVAFAVSLIAALFFLITAIMQIFLVRHHKKEKRYGPSPSNNYTSGSAKKRNFWARKNKNADRDAELGATGTAVGNDHLAPAGAIHDTRPSHETGYTGSTVAAPNANTYDKTEGAENFATAPHAHAPHGTHGGYYTQPQGTGVNPYGYDARPNTYTTGTATNY